MDGKFTIVKKGYHTVEVDDYINSLESIIKSYKDKEAAIQNALINAEISAQAIIGKAKNEALVIIKGVNVQVEAVAGSISAQKSVLEAFKEDYIALVMKHLQKMNGEEMTRLTEKLDKIEKALCHSAPLSVENFPSDYTEEATVSFL